MLAPRTAGEDIASLGLNASDSVLEVGTGTGYLTACLSMLGSSTHSIDIRAEFTAACRRESACRTSGPRRDWRRAMRSMAHHCGEYNVIAVNGSLRSMIRGSKNALRVGGPSIRRRRSGAR